MEQATILSGLIAATPGYQGARQTFCEGGTIAAYLRFERALAEAQGALGVIPPDAAQAITAVCRIDRLDLAALREGAARVGYSIVPLVAALSRQAGPFGQWVHYGTTSQDVMDTGLALQLRDRRGPLMAALERVCAGLAAQADRHRATPMAGRSKLQHAAPITFGYRAAVWLDQLLRCRDRLAQAFEACAVVQFGGAVGTLSSLGGAGVSVRDELAARLDLAVPDISWHVSRDRFADLVYCLAAVLAAMAKIAGDTAFLMATEVGELREPFAEGRGSSSTMPQKRNPVLCEAILEAARMARSAPGQMLEAMGQDQDRGIGFSYLEGRALADTLALAEGAADLLGELLAGMEVNTDRMGRNLDATQGMINAEAAMIGLSRRFGRIEAHRLLHAMCRTAEQSGRSLADVMADTLPVPVATDTSPDGALDAAQKALPGAAPGPGLNTAATKGPNTRADQDAAPDWFDAEAAASAETAMIDAVLNRVRAGKPV